MSVHWKTIGYDSNPKTHNDKKFFIKIPWSLHLKMVIILMTYEKTYLF